MAEIILFPDSDPVTFLVKTRRGARQFTCAGSEPYIRRDGSMTTLALWRGKCWTCGRAFVVKTPLACQPGRSKVFQTARCEEHRRYVGNAKCKAV